MAKQTFNANTFAAKTFASGTYRGVGIAAPNAPINLTATPISASEIDLAWQDGGGSPTTWLLERSPDDSTWSQIASLPYAQQTYQDTGLAASTTFFYRVRASNSGGDSPYSNVASAATLAKTAAAGFPSVFGSYTWVRRKKQEMYDKNRRRRRHEEVLVSL